MTEGFEIEGLDELQKELDRLEERISEISGEKEIPLVDLFPPSFMRDHTAHSDIDSFTEASGLFTNGLSPEEVAEIVSSDKWDEWVRAQTAFEGWMEMLAKAKVVYANRLLEG